MMMRAGAVLALCTGCCLVGEKAQRPLRVEASAGESLVEVRDRVRTLLASNRVQGVTVTLAPGTYFLPQGIGRMVA